MISHVLLTTWVSDTLGNETSTSSVIDSLVIKKNLFLEIKDTSVQVHKMESCLSTTHNKQHYYDLIYGRTYRLLTRKL